MSDNKHAAGVRNIKEGDTVTLETDEALIVEAECTKTFRKNTRGLDVVRETRQWYFEKDDKEMMVQITDGLRSFTWEAEYPRHKPLYNMSDNEQFGFIQTVKIHGKVEV